MKLFKTKPSVSQSLTETIKKDVELVSATIEDLRSAIQKAEDLLTDNNVKIAALEVENHNLEELITVHKNLITSIEDALLQKALDSLPHTEEEEEKTGIEKIQEEPFEDLIEGEAEGFLTEC